jgi:hypothetical protein
MPSINVDKLIDILNDIQMRLYSVWELSKNPEITVIIEQERERLSKLVISLENYKALLE